MRRIANREDKIMAIVFNTYSISEKLQMRVALRQSRRGNAYQAHHGVAVLSGIITSTCSIRPIMRSSRQLLSGENLV